MAKVLITGISGFAASHLARALLAEGNEVHGTIRTRSDLSKIKDLPIVLHLVELTDAFSIEKVIVDVRPDEIYHLAAQSYVKQGWDAPIETYRTTVEGTINLFEAIRKHCKPDVAILVTSTSEIYGQVNGTINEETPPNPITHYGISKYCQDMIARLYHRTYNLNVVVTRAFNNTGPGRARVFVDSTFAKQIAEIENGAEPIIKHGNLTSARDFVDVRDVVRGYIAAMRSKRWGEIFCLGTGQPRTIQEILDILIGLSTNKNITTQIEAERLRPVDTASMCCDYTKAKQALGWEPTIPLEESLEDLLNWWRQYD